MLGEQIGEEAGKVIVRRVISVDGGTKVEVTVQGTGKLLGVETRNTVTYVAGIRPDGSLYGEAQGLVVGKGGEQAPPSRPREWASSSTTELSAIAEPRTITGNPRVLADGAPLEVPWSQGPEPLTYRGTTAEGPLA